MAVKTVIGSANRITFITEKDSVSDTSRPTMIPPSSCPHSAIKWHSNGTTDTQLTKSKKDNQIKLASIPVLFLTASKTTHPNLGHLSQLLKPSEEYEAKFQQCEAALSCKKNILMYQKL